MPEYDIHGRKIIKLRSELDDLMIQLGKIQRNVTEKVKELQTEITNEMKACEACEKKDMKGGAKKTVKKTEKKKSVAKKKTVVKKKASAKKDKKW
jgi:hypothetical protein